MKKIIVIVIICLIAIGSEYLYFEKRIKQMELEAYIYAQKNKELIQDIVSKQAEINNANQKLELLDKELQSKEARIDELNKTYQQNIAEYQKGLRKLIEKDKAGQARLNDFRIMLADCNNIVDEQLSLLSAKDSEIIVLKQQKETLTSIIKNKDIIISKQYEYIKQEEQLIERLKHNYDKKDKKEYIYPSIVVGAFILGAIIAN